MMWWLLPALMGTVAQIAGTILAGRGAPLDSPWPDDRSNRLGLHWEMEKWIRDYAAREKSRIWGASLTTSGALLLLLGAVLATNTLSFSMTQLLTILLLGSVARSLGMAFRKTRSTNRWKAIMIREVSGGEGKGQKEDRAAGGFRERYVRPGS